MTDMTRLWDAIAEEALPEFLYDLRRRVDAALTDDGHIRGSRIVEAVAEEALPVVDVESIRTSLPTPTSTATDLETQLLDSAELLVDNSPVGVVTAGIAVTATPAELGTEIAADLIFAGDGGDWGSDDRAARSDHRHDAGSISRHATATLAFPSIAAQTCAELTITVTGAAVGDGVILAPPAGLEANLAPSGRVTAADTVTVRLCNVTTSAIAPTSAGWGVFVI